MTQRLWLALSEGEIEQKFPLDSSDYVTNKQASEHATLDGRGDAAKLFDDVWAREGLHTVRRVRGGKLGEGRPDHSYRPDGLRLARESVQKMRLGKASFDVPYGGWGLANVGSEVSISSQPSLSAFICLCFYPFFYLCIIQRDVLFIIYTFPYFHM